MELSTLEMALELDQRTANEWYSRYVNKGLGGIYRMLGMDNLDVVRAEGCELTLRDGSTVLDFTSALGILSLGHNHPRILEAERLFGERRQVDALKLGPGRLQGILARNLAQILPDPLEVSFFGVSGAEAVEAALKLCVRAQQDKGKKIFVTTEGSFHGRTHGTLTVTTSGNFRDNFILSIPEDHVVSVPYGDAPALVQALDHRIEGGRNDVVAMILEPVQGQGVNIPSEGYLEDVVRICRERDILVVCDEVKCGMCRTGPFCAFMDTTAVPDVVTLSKALGGGRRAISAMVTSQALFDKAYGSRDACALHGTTFGGMAGSCALGIKTLEILFEPGFQDAVREKGAYFLGRLKALQEKHPDQVAEVRGKGMLLAVRFRYDGKGVPSALVQGAGKLCKMFNSAAIAAIVRELYTSHRILAHFVAPHPDTLQIMPPLVSEKIHVDRFVDGLDAVLDKGLVRTMASFAKGVVAGVFK